MVRAYQTRRNGVGRSRRWSNGTEVEDYPDAVITPNGSIHTVYAALSIASAIWRIPLTPSGERGGDPELLTAMYKAGSPSLSFEWRNDGFFPPSSSLGRAFNWRS